MNNFIVYNQEGEILQAGHCSSDISNQRIHSDEFVMEGTANGGTQKIEFDGFDEKDQPINSRVVDKTQEEIKVEKPPEPPEIPFEKQVAYITNKQWQDVLDKITNLEKKWED